MIRLLLSTLLLLTLSACSNWFAKPEPDQLYFRWQSQIGEGSELQKLKLPPLVSGETIYIGSHSGIVRALNRESGRKLWQQRVESALLSGPVSHGSSLIFGGEGEVIALNKESGKVEWRIPVGSEVIAEPTAISDRQVLVRSVDGRAVSLNPTSNQQDWRYEWTEPALTLRGESPIFVVGDELYIGTSTAEVIALGLKRGELRWRTKLARAQGRNPIERLIDIDAPLLLSDKGHLIASVWKDGIYAIDRTDGNSLWNRPISTHSGILSHEGRLFFTDHLGQIWALDSSNGSTFWKQDSLKGRELTQAAIMGKLLIFADNQGILHRVAMEDGTIIDSFPLLSWKERFPIKEIDLRYKPREYQEPKPIHIAPVVVENWLYAVDQRGILSAWSLGEI